MNEEPNSAQSVASRSSLLWCCGVALLETLVSCAPSDHPLAQEAAADVEEQESDAGGTLDGGPEWASGEPDAGHPEPTGDAGERRVDVTLAQVCGADPALDLLLGCTDSAIAICTASMCDGGSGPDLTAGWDPFVNAVEAVTNGAVVTQARDGGGDLACQTNFVACIGDEPTEQGVERCEAEAAKCGFTGDAGPSIACSAQFAQCFLADLFAYDRCIAVFRACEAALSTRDS